ncbi:spore germination protein [Anaerocolumna jejuensis DSM 15929]|uniref:Spore germination protein n=1 Tax=Anaerocolumna jejuensis DSM 15929 TaxID=1121322 RepID=A0A1M6KEX8_9FIRM|nr:LysM peptidoglycan-binding domain-containing protein [Anaerocolumna jejuensis]SHJ57545.1 spore germination protein [Anaerocolumna jejuensis DSM 15929]
MDIYIVQQGDTIYYIADKYGISVEKLTQDNGLIFPYNLVIGQAIVIAIPKQSHTVQQGDTLQSIADTYNIPLMQLLRNNPFLSDRQYLYQGEELVISYNTIGGITMNGYAYPHIMQDTLLKTLPNLTYISILNYQIAENGEIISFQDDSEVIIKSKEYGVIPLMLITPLLPQGVPDYQTSIRTLLNEEYQDKLIDKFIEIIHVKGYYGVNIIFNFLNVDTQSLFLNFTKKVSNRAKQEGLLFFLTINYKIKETNNEIIFEKVNYSNFNDYVDGFVFLDFVWGTNYSPPKPVCNMYHIGILVDYLISSGVSKNKLIIGKPIVGYDWKLPFKLGSGANSLTLFSALDLAYNFDAIIGFDKESQTPYYYKELLIDLTSEHIVWYLDSRSFNSLDKLIIDTNLNGAGIWNIMIYYPQLWIVVYSQYDIIKLI